MIIKADLKILFRSRSWSFLKKYRQKDNLSTDYVIFTWKGQSLYYRPGTSDPGLIYEILLKSGQKSEYWIPESVAPQTILDIGANIGVASVYFANVFPSARIYSCEPVPNNYALLLKNTEGRKNITSFNIGLSKESGTFKMRASDARANLGGYSLHNLGVDESREVEVTIKTPDEFINEIGIDRFDLIKIDTEGSEFDIITAIDKNILANTTWIIGELHGIRDFELLAYLSDDFYIDVRKTLNKRLFKFNACNKKKLQSINLKRIKYLQY